MNKIIIFELVEVTNCGKSLILGLPLYSIKEIKEIPNNKESCLVNGNEVKGNIEQIITKINLFFKNNKEI